MTSFYLYNIICFTKKTSFWFKINFKEFHPLLIEIWASIFRVGVLPHVTLPRHYSAVTWTPWRLEIKGHSIGCSTVCTGNIKIKNSTTSQHLCEGNPPLFLPLTKGAWYRKCFIVITLSCAYLADEQGRGNLQEGCAESVGFQRWLRGQWQSLHRCKRTPV